MSISGPFAGDNKRFRQTETLGPHDIRPDETPSEWIARIHSDQPSLSHAECLPVRPQRRHFSNVRQT